MESTEKMDLWAYDDHKGYQNFYHAKLNWAQNSTAHKN